jgi:deoxyguanosine kinase
MQNKYSFITIEGNIGVGKTTLSTKLAKTLNAQLILESFAENAFLPKFYKEPEKYAFPLEMSFLSERFIQLKKILNTRDMFQENIISDYLFIKCKLFAKVNLPADEYNLFSTFFDIIAPKLPEPELIIFLYAPISKLQQNIKSRAREYEQNIPDNYLENIQEGYKNFIKSQSIPTLMIDSSKTDFLNNEQHFNKLLEYLQQDFSNNVHYLDF